jgi:hypothetical protein
LATETQRAQRGDWDLTYEYCPKGARKDTKGDEEERREKTLLDLLRALRVFVVGKTHLSGRVMMRRIRDGGR